MNHNDEEFYTVRGYAILRQEDNSLTPSMEDYLEMAYRLSKDRGFARIGDLAAALNVQPSSASKMVQRLSEMNYLCYEKYGIIELTAQGQELGNYLMGRHETLEQFLRIIGVTQGILEETEKLEHSISVETLGRIRALVKLVQQNRQWADALKS